MIVQTSTRRCMLVRASASTRPVPVDEPPACAAVHLDAGPLRECCDQRVRPERIPGDEADGLRDFGGPVRLGPPEVQGHVVVDRDAQARAYPVVRNGTQTSAATGTIASSPVRGGRIEGSRAAA